MNDQPTLDLQNSESDDSLNLATYAQRAYLEYALSVRAVPCLMCVMVKNQCKGAFCIPCLAWDWAFRAPRVPSRLKVRAW
ncbi:MAG: topoisomerase 4 subunit [Pseudomonadota bacterium]